MPRPPATKLAFISGLTATAATLARLEEGDESIEYQNLTIDAYIVGICAGIFLMAYSLAAAIGRLVVN